MDCVEDVNTCADYGTYTRRTRTADRAAMYHTAW